MSHQYCTQISVTINRGKSFLGSAKETAALSLDQSSLPIKRCRHLRATVLTRPGRSALAAEEQIFTL